MLRRASIIAVFLLAGCGETATPGAGQSGDAPGAAASPGPGAAPIAERVALPIEAPATADVTTQDFFAVCSRAMVDRNDGYREAVKRGWRAGPEQVATLATFGMAMFEPPEDRGLSGMMQLNAVTYPHLSGETCMVNILQGGAPETLDYSAFESLPNVKGQHTMMPASLGANGAGRGLYSFIGPEGDVVTITVIHAPPHMLQMTMATSRRVDPGAATAQKPD